MTSEKPQEKAPFRVLVIGGSYAGLAATVNLLDLCHGKPCRFAARYSEGASRDAAGQPRVPIQVTIVDERDGFFHLIGAPMAFASCKYASDTWSRYEDIPALRTPEVKFVHGSIVDLNCQGKEATVKDSKTQASTQVQYDYLIAASGLRRTWPTVPQALQRKEYMSEMTSHINATEKADNGVVVVGGGAVGIEMSAELKNVQPHRKVTLIHSRSKLLSSEPLSDECKDCAYNLLRDAGVETVMNTRVNDIEEKPGPSFELSLSDGRKITTSMVINAISKFSPTTSYLPDAVLDNEGYVKIKPNLEFPDAVPNASYHYATGDIVSWPGIKRCGAAMHHGHYTAMNLHQKMLAELKYSEQPKLNELSRDVPPGIGLAVGKKAVSYSPLTGVQAGEDVADLFFGKDLGFSICWNYMQLGDQASPTS